MQHVQCQVVDLVVASLLRLLFHPYAWRMMSPSCAQNFAESCRSLCCSRRLEFTIRPCCRNVPPVFATRRIYAPPLSPRRRRGFSLLLRDSRACSDKQRPHAAPPQRWMAHTREFQSSTLSLSDDTGGYIFITKQLKPRLRHSQVYFLG